MTMWVLNYNCTGSFPSSAFQASCHDTSQAHCKSQGWGCKTHRRLQRWMPSLFDSNWISINYGWNDPFLKWEYISWSLKISLSCSEQPTSWFTCEKMTFIPSPPPWIWGQFQLWQLPLWHRSLTQVYVLTSLQTVQGFSKVDVSSQLTYICPPENEHWKPPIQHHQLKNESTSWRDLRAFNRRLTPGMYKLVYLVKLSDLFF